MWTIQNRTSFSVDSTWGRDQNGAHQWIVVVKATFAIGDGGRLSRADEQERPSVAAEYHGEPGLSSLRYEADLCEPKPTTDVLLNGVAHAPGQKASSEFVVSLRVGDVNKQLLVRGDRRWVDGPLGTRPSPARPVRVVPIVYERAFGGFDDTAPDARRHRLDGRNPVGCGVAGPESDRAGRSLPNFEYPDGPVEKRGPAGFGPIDSHWSPRRELMGTYDEAWLERRSPLLPHDWSSRSLQCAPADQQAASPLKGGESIELVNLTPDGRLSFPLPRADFVFTTSIAGRGVEEHGCFLASVVIEPEVSRLMMVWSTALEFRGEPEDLQRTVVHERFVA